jgi:flagellar basal body-associated protein FliL
MGQQQTMAEQQAGGALMRRILMVILVATLMALLMAASAASAFAGPNSGSAAGQCKPPGQSISNLAGHPTTTGAPGQIVKGKCAPGQQ